MGCPTSRLGAKYAVAVYVSSLGEAQGSMKLERTEKADCASNVLMSLLPLRRVRRRLWALASMIPCIAVKSSASEPPSGACSGAVTPQPSLAQAPPVRIQVQSPLSLIWRKPLRCLFRRSSPLSPKLVRRHRSNLATAVSLIWHRLQPNQGTLPP